MSQGVRPCPQCGRPVDAATRICPVCAPAGAPPAYAAAPAPASPPLAAPPPAGPAYGATYVAPPASSAPASEEPGIPREVIVGLVVTLVLPLCAGVFVLMNRRNNPAAVQNPPAIIMPRGVPAAPGLDRRGLPVFPTGPASPRSVPAPSADPFGSSRTRMAEDRERMRQEAEAQQRESTRRMDEMLRDSRQRMRDSQRESERMIAESRRRMEEDQRRVRERMEQQRRDVMDRTMRLTPPGGPPSAPSFPSPPSFPAPGPGSGVPPGVPGPQ